MGPCSVCDQADRCVDDRRCANTDQSANDEADADQHGIEPGVVGDPTAHTPDLAIAAVEAETLARDADGGPAAPGRTAAGAVWFFVRDDGVVKGGVNVRVRACVL